MVFMIVLLVLFCCVLGFLILLRYWYYGYVGIYCDVVYLLYFVGFFDDDEWVCEVLMMIMFCLLIVIVIVIVMRGYEVCFVDLKFFDLIVDVGLLFYDDKILLWGLCGCEFYVIIWIEMCNYIGY